jgi:cytochrome c oxidase assembly factor CtaG
MLTPFGEFLDSTLALHMVVQHVFYLAGGFMLASGADLLVLGWSKFSETVTSAYTAVMRANVHFNRCGLLAFVLAAAATAYWHIPANFDTAVLNENVHILILFTIVGGLSFIGSGLLTGRMRHILLLVPGKAMVLFGVFLLFTSAYVYPVCPSPEQAEAWLVMVGMMLVIDLTIAPYWLYKYFGSEPSGLQVECSKKG